VSQFSGINSATPLQAAERYIELGLHPVPAPYKTKAPRIDGWQKLRITGDQASGYFVNEPQNMGLILGENGLCDIDCDTSESVVAAAALLPHTGMVFGRAAKPASHYFYFLNQPVPLAQFKDPTDKKMLVELRCQKKDGGTGLQTIVPPSVHPEGEKIQFEPGRDREPARVDAAQLRRAVMYVAAAALLARHWPQKGSRHEAMLALAGAQWHAGWPKEAAKKFCQAVYRAVPTHDPQALTRSDREVEDTYTRGAAALERGEEAKMTGQPTLCKLLGDIVVSTAMKWLPPPDGSAPAPPTISVPVVGAHCNATEETAKGKLAAVIEMPAPATGQPQLSTAATQAPDRQPTATAIEGKEIVRSIADRLMVEGHYAYDEAERLYRYEDGRYTLCDFAVRRETQVLMEKSGLSGKWSSHRGREVVAYITLKSPKVWDEPPADEINLKNGILNIHTGLLRPHSPEFLSPIQIPVTFDPTATCPQWDGFITEVFPEDSPELAWEILGDLITPDRSIQKAGLLTGEGGNGKGVYLAGCIAFVGRENVATIPLHKLESDRFSVAQLYGKLVNCCADLPSGDLTSTSMFKALTGGDIITGERKYENSFSFKPYARLLFSANHPPRSADATKAFFDRWLVIPFDRSFRGTKKERPRRELDAALADPRELSGVLNKALAALQRLRARGRFTETESTARAMAEMQQVTDPLAVWLDHETVTLPNASVPCGDLLLAYNDECARSGRPPANKTAFGMAIRRLRPGVNVRKRGGRGEQKDCYVGIGIMADARFRQEEA
jgi:putative DNA primase/helicase